MSSLPPERSPDPDSFPGGTPGGGRRQGGRELGSWRAPPFSLVKGDGRTTRGCGGARHGTVANRVGCVLRRRGGRWPVWGVASPRELASCGCRHEEARRRHFFNSGWVATGKGKGGPDGYTIWLCVGCVRKIIRFWQKRSPNCDFWVFHSPSSLSTSKNI
jgi:hypothetical protein